MRHEPSKGFLFELPDGWHHSQVERESFSVPWACYRKHCLLLIDWLSLLGERHFRDFRGTGLHVGRTDEEAVGT